jgi:sigma-B regulation protein RsbU (phosphoserine phosphatase)
MKFVQRLGARLQRLGKLEKLFGAVLLLYVVLRLAFPGGPVLPLLAFALVIAGFWLVIRYTRAGIRTAIWRLRNRLLVTYLFIAVIPVLLIITLAALGAYALASQVAVYLATSELDRKVAAMQTATDTLARTEPPVRKEVMWRLGEIYRDKYPGVTMLIQDRASLQRWPESADVSPPGKDWGEISGVVLRDGHYHAWSHVVKNGVQITAAVPLTRRFLSEMVPGLGEVYFLQVSTNPQSPRAAPKSGFTVSKASGTRMQVDGRDIDFKPAARESTSSMMPEPVNRFDVDVQWPSVMPVSAWHDASKTELALLLVRTRFSAILGIISSRKVDQLQGLLPVLLAVIAILFMIVEIVSIVIGTSLTRTVTGAVHSLYEGTQKVMQGDFKHRITVSGKDQLADLGTSFNTMTENLERLLAVAKEKERLQAELEIAREVQEQLYPKTAPVVRTLRLTAVCQPARMVSGDYYDFQRLHENKLAIAIGDVAGKGISAALLMATIQSAMRMELRSCMELAAPSHQALNGFRHSTARMVTELNQQLHATTSPEKYATFYFSLYDEITGMLTYTNAGHLPPILFRNGQSSCLDVNGTVVGAFPMSQYDESKVQLESGDLLLCYTDGVTEPENEYGEMFGEERLIDLVARNIDREETRIIELVMDAVRLWTGTPELQDDMTVLLARKQ